MDILWDIIQNKLPALEVSVSALLRERSHAASTGPSQRCPRGSRSPEHPGRHARRVQVGQSPRLGGRRRVRSGDAR
ncbi:MAG: hypothetical protein ACREJ9_11085 [Candidatus Rokuibacteriota bacterium]